VADVGPFFEQDAVEALDFAVGLGPVGAGALVGAAGAVAGLALRAWRCGLGAAGLALRAWRCGLGAIGCCGSRTRCL